MAISLKSYQRRLERPPLPPAVPRPWPGRVLLLFFDLPDAAHALGEPPGVGVEELLELVALLEGDGRLLLRHHVLEIGLVHRLPDGVTQLREHRRRRGLR